MIYIFNITVMHRCMLFTNQSRTAKVYKKKHKDTGVSIHDNLTLVMKYFWCSEQALYKVIDRSDMNVGLEHVPETVRAAHSLKICCQVFSLISNLKHSLRDSRVVLLPAAIA